MKPVDRKSAPPPVPVSSREVWRWETSGGEVAVVELQEFESGRRIVALRRWYRDREGDLRPGRHGISFPLSDLDDIEKAVEALRVVVPRPAAPDDDPIDQGDQDDVVQDALTAEIDRALKPAFSPYRFSSLPRFPRRRVDPAGSDPAKPSAPMPPAAAEVKPVAHADIPAVASRRPVVEVGGAQDVEARRKAAAPPYARKESLLSEIFAMGLVSSPLALRLEVGRTTLTGMAYADGSVMFGNRRFANPREAVAVLRNQKHVVDAWHSIRYRNPKTNRFARLSRLRGLFHGLSEAGELSD